MNRNADFAATAPWDGVLNKPDFINMLKADPAGKTFQRWGPNGWVPFNWDGSWPDIGGLEDRLFRTRSLADEDLYKKILGERLTRSLANEDLGKKIYDEIFNRSNADDIVNQTILSVQTAAHADSTALVAIEQSARIESDGAINAQILSLVQAINAESGSAAAISEERIARIAADGTVTATLNTEVAARQGGDSGVSAQVDEERASRIATDGTIQASLTTEITARGTAVSGVQASILSEQVARISADGGIQSQVLDLIDAVNAETGAVASIASERQARLDADGTIQATVNDEVAARLYGDNAVSAQVDTERQARIDALGNIQASLDIEVTARGVANTGLQAQVTSESVARVGADGSLGAEYVLEVSTNSAGQKRIAGFRTTVLGGSSGHSEFVIQADKMGIVQDDGEGGLLKPFIVVGGVVYITTAVIQDLTVGTQKLAPNAATNINAVQQSGSFFYNGSADIFLCELNIITDGYPLLIIATTSGSPAGNLSAYILVDGVETGNRGGSVIATSLVGGGNHNIQLLYHPPIVGRAGEYGANIVVIELKR